MAEEEEEKKKRREARQGMNANFQIDRVDPSNLPIKQPLAKTTTVLSV